LLLFCVLGIAVWVIKLALLVGKKRESGGFGEGGVERELPRKERHAHEAIEDTI
jgi:hypothetical protein